MKKSRILGFISSIAYSINSYAATSASEVEKALNPSKIEINAAIDYGIIFFGIAFLTRGGYLMFKQNDYINGILNAVVVPSILAGLLLAKKFS